MAGVTPALMHYYKDLWNGHKIIYVRFSSYEYIFRTLTRHEYAVLYQSGYDTYTFQEAICDKALLYPETEDRVSFNSCPFAGLPEYVSDLILDLSGVNNIDRVMQEYKAYRDISNLETQCMDLIKAFIPEYTYEEMMDWTWQKLMQMTVRAEKVAELKGFDWHIEDNSKEYVEKISQINMDNEEFLKKLREAGIDPMVYFKDELAPTKNDLIAKPFIGGTYWNDEEVVNAIGAQVRSTRRYLSSIHGFS